MSDKKGFPWFVRKLWKGSERMEVGVMKIKPYKGKYASRKKANYVNDLLLSSKKPDHAALKKEAEEFIEYIKEKRSIQKI